MFHKNSVYSLNIKNFSDLLRDRGLNCLTTYLRGERGHEKVLIRHPVHLEPEKGNVSEIQQVDVSLPTPVSYAPDAG